MPTQLAAGYRVFLMFAFSVISKKTFTLTVAACPTRLTREANKVCGSLSRWGGWFPPFNSAYKISLADEKWGWHMRGAPSAKQVEVAEVRTVRDGIKECMQNLKEINGCYSKLWPSYFTRNYYNHSNTIHQSFISFYKFFISNHF